VQVAVIGTGNIGATLGGALARAGHHVVLGSRHAQDVAPIEGPTVADIPTALDGADVVLLALPGAAVAPFAAEHAAALAGRLVIDATNRMGGATANAAAEITAAVPSARYARAFNTLGWENFARPTFDGVAADLFFSAPADDRATVEQLISDVGLRPMYLGEGKQDLVDSVLPLWFTLAQLHGQRHLAFRVLHD
jgi:predicted dinucleotide-binding enzyme